MLLITGASDAPSTNHARNTIRTKQSVNTIDQPRLSASVRSGKLRQLEHIAGDHPLSDYTRALQARINEQTLGWKRS